MRQPLHNHPRRKGTVAPFVALVMFPIFLLMLAFSVDMGNVCFTQAQLQRAADAGALAGAAELVKHRTAADAYTYAIAEAQRVVSQTSAGNQSLLRLNLNNSPPDVQVGFTVQNPDGSPGAFIAYPGVVSGVLNGLTPFPNTVIVTVRRDSTVNGQHPNFFAGFFGQSSWPMGASAAATTIMGSAFNLAAQGGLLLPFAIPQNTTVNLGGGTVGGVKVGWNDLTTLWRGGPGTTVSGTDPGGIPYLLWFSNGGAAPIGTTLTLYDNYSVGTTLEPANSGTPFSHYAVTSPGSDGSPELALYGDGSTAAGNFGVISLNPNASPSTSQIENWVSNGPSGSDLSSLTFPTVNSNGTVNAVSWSADPGFKNAISSTVNNIVGEPRLVAIYSGIGGSGGANATYTIVGYAPVVILGWSGSGSNAQLTIEPAGLVDPSMVGTSYGNGLPPTAGTVYAAPQLTQVPSGTPYGNQ